jgi:hypothetical protein
MMIQFNRKKIYTRLYKIINYIYIYINDQSCKVKIATNENNNLDETNDVEHE